MKRLATLVLTSIALIALAAPVARAQHEAPATTEHQATTDAATDAGHDAAAGAGDHPADHAEGAHHDPHGVLPNAKQALVPAFATLIVFSLVLFVLGTTVWPKILKGLNDRADKIREEIASAEAARKQANDALQQYEKNLAEARAEAQAMLDQTKTQQAALAADLRAKAEAELADMRDKARRDIDAARKAAVNELYAEAANLATLMASKVLQREVSDQDNKTLLDESLAELASKNN